jgi:cation-transporting ATPase E
VGLWVLVILARPFNWWKTVLVASMAGCVALILVVPWLRDFYALQFPPPEVVVEAGIVAATAIALLEVGWRLSRVVANRRAVA